MSLNLKPCDNKLKCTEYICKSTNLQETRCFQGQRRYNCFNKYYSENILVIRNIIDRRLVYLCIYVGKQFI